MKVPGNWNVFPLPKGKKFPPVLKEWETTIFPREKIRKHTGNFALGCGNISGGVIVFDWDFRKKQKNKITEIYKEYREKLGDLAHTLIVETPNGFHLYYNIKDSKLGNTAQKNIGFSSTLKKFYSKNETRFGEYLNGLDTRANGGYVVIPPSIINQKKYKWYVEAPIQEITLEDYDKIMNFFEEPNPQQHTIRKGFVDIIMGKVDPNDIATKDTTEQVYWKEMYHEVWNCSGIKPEDLFKGLAKHQKGFDLEKTKTQLANSKNIDYIYSKGRLGKSKYKLYFPYLAKPSTQPTMFKETPVKTTPKPTTPITTIYYNNGMIQMHPNSILYITGTEKNPVSTKILGCSFKIFRKCIHRKEARYSFILNGKLFHTCTILEILSKAEPYLRAGNKGRDCLKEVIEVYAKQLEATQPKEFLGFDNGWILPQTEEEKEISIIVITDYQQDAYEKATKMFKEYSEKQKKQISLDLKKFMTITQCETINQAILVGWSIASCFRLFFIREYDLFPILYNYGPPNTGRSSLEDFWIIKFYGIYDSHLPPNTSIARLEDHLSKGIFPHSLQDIKEENLYANKDLIGMLLDYSTSVGLFERKKNLKEVAFIKYKIAGLNLDSNDILSSFSNPAINERQIFVQYNKKTILDLEWTQLRKKLKRYKLFSFIYEYTKNWTDNDVDELYSNILKRFTETFEVNSSRLLKSGAIIRFGLDLFAKAFNFKINIKDVDIMKVITEGSSKMTEGVVDQFRGFCNIALSYDVSTQLVKEYSDGEAYPEINRGENPKYLNHQLQMDSEKEYYAYTSSNHEDYKRRYGERCGIKSLVEKVQKGLDLEESKMLEYVTARPFRINSVKCKPMNIIRINPTFLNEREKVIEGLILDIDYGGGES